MEPNPATALIEAMPLPAVLIEATGRIAAANTHAQTLFGALALGRDFRMSFRQPELATAIEAALVQAIPMQARYTTARAALQPATYRVTINPITAATAAALCTFEDVTEAELISQMRRDFVANVSHELRTPLTALLGFIETLRGAARDDATARTRFLAIMNTEAERMNRLIGDLLSLSRVEAQERVRPTTLIDLRDIIGAVLDTLRPMAAEAGITLEISGTDRPFEALADADQLTQVFSNLLENAIKYGGSGKLVSVEMAHLPLDPQLRLPALVISVTDRGEGIDPVHLPRLTERFYRVDTHRSRQKGGTGLGLAIVKHILSRHRGRLRIDSTIGLGSRFQVILPAP